ncbi:MAG: hypothetical protein EYC69_08310 [Bacteroidetes bacterium]|nr:MAG: hypothetical protein EYC69_08310 [Bacteroidota bacterium]
MKKKIIVPIVIAAVLGTLAIYLLKRDDSSSMRTELMDFAVKDTASITKIFLANRNGNSVTLSRKNDGQWVLNDSLSPRPDVMKNLVTAVYSISVKSRVPQSGYNNVITDLASGGIKCEVYLSNQEKPAKVYYVGNQTADALGTFMMMENSNVPFVMEIPGFNGYLTPWYNPIIEIWIEPVIFRLQADQIKSLSLSYPSFPQWSFSLERNANKFQLAVPSQGKVYSEIDSVAVDNYLALYQNVFYEVPEGRLSKATKDSILQTFPLNELKILTNENKEQGIIIYPMAINESSIILQDSIGNPLKYDVDRMYGFITHEKRWVVIQHYNFDRLFRRAEDFMLKKRALRGAVQ